METAKVKKDNIVATVRPASVCRFGNMIVLIFIAIWFFITPFWLCIYYITDPALRTNRMPRFALHVHKVLSPKYERWAKARVKTGKAKKLGTDQIAPTEWPAFGSVFYLWATESLQQGWDQDKRIAPKAYAAGAIKAAAELVADPNHATWVKEHWGDDYLHDENVFYRMLLIGGLTSYQKLIGGNKYTDLLRDQVDTLSRQLDESPCGLLDDYPRQCFPADVAAAIAAIRRADEVLGTDHSEFVSRSIRGFEGDLLDESTRLFPYMADANKCLAIDMARGCSTQWGTTWAAELWPETAKKWYVGFENHFWQRRFGAVGFREFEKNAGMPEWYIDVDSGPVLAGFGASASAFGMGTARASSRFDHAYPLAAELILASWPLPDGTLLVPRFLSNATHAKYIGEACLLFSFTRTPRVTSLTMGSTKLPRAAYYLLAAYLLIGCLLTWLAYRTFNRWRKWASSAPIRLGKMQLAFWLALICAGVALYLLDEIFIGLLLVLFAQLLPRGEKRVVVRQLVQEP